MAPAETTASYEFATGAVKVSLAITATQNTGSDGRDTLQSIENLLGSAFNDELTGGADVNRIEGGNGDDLIVGGAGIDRLDGGQGSDIYVVNSLSEKTAAEITDSGVFGTDELRYAATTAGTLVLAAGDTGLERIAIGTGKAATAVATGTTALSVDASAAANGLTIVGNAGINTLTGSAYNDMPRRRQRQRHTLRRCRERHAGGWRRQRHALPVAKVPTSSYSIRRPTLPTTVTPSTTSRADRTAYIW